MSTTAPVVTTGNTAGQLMQATSSGVGGGTMGFLAALATAPTAAVTRYAVTSKELLGAALDGTTTTYNSGVATGGSTTTLVDASAFWATATGTGSAQGFTITLKEEEPMIEWISLMSKLKDYIEKVFKDEDGYFTTVKSSSGIYYTARFNSEEDAEIYAEDWVNKDE
jgi:hypothetical protein